MVFKDPKALQTVKREEVPKGINALGAHLFTVEKFDANGEHEKFKSRLVSHGNEQDSNLYLERSSPTVSVHVIMTCLVAVACKDEYTLGKIDVKDAFIQMEMSGMPMYIKYMGTLK